MIRIIPFILFSFLFDSAIGQSGSIKIDVYSNDDCNMSSNEIVYDYTLLVQNHKGDTIHIENVSNNNKKEVFYKRGIYTVSATLNDGRTLKVDEVDVTPDMIRFVKVLFEDDCDLSRRQLRQRKKSLFENY